MNQNDLRCVYRTFTNVALEQGTFKSRNSDGVNFTSYALTALRRRPIDKAQRLAAGLLASQWSTLEVWQDDLDLVAAPAPKVNDILVDSASVSWVIHDIEVKLQKQLFRCSCQRLVS